jgi:hypothetical protein
MVKKNKDANAKKVAILIGKFRTERLENPFSELQLTAMLKEAKCAYHKQIVKGLFKAGVATKKEDGSVVFASTEPVHYLVIKRFHDEASKTVADYQMKSKLNKTDPDAQKITNAITFLKSKGYEIYGFITEKRKM